MRNATAEGGENGNHAWAAHQGDSHRHNEGFALGILLGFGEGRKDHLNACEEEDEATGDGERAAFNLQHAKKGLPKGQRQDHGDQRKTEFAHQDLGMTLFGDGLQRCQKDGQVAKGVREH